MNKRELIKKQKEQEEKQKYEEKVRNQNIFFKQHVNIIHTQTEKEKFLKRVKEIHKTLENNPNTLLTQTDYVDDIVGMKNVIIDEKQEYGFNACIICLHCFSLIAHRKISLSEREIIPDFHQFITSLKEFLLYWAGFFCCEEEKLNSKSWATFLNQYHLLRVAIMEDGEWSRFGKGSYFLYAEKKEKDEEDKQVNEMIEENEFNEDDLISEEERTLRLNRMDFLLQQNNKAQENEEKRLEEENTRKMIIEDIKRDDSDEYRVTPSQKIFYPWFTKVFIEMYHSIAIINSIKKWTRVTMTQECSKFCSGMELLVKKYLGKSNQKALINQFRDKKIFDVAYVPGLINSTNVYADVVNADIWKIMYTDEFEIFVDLLTSDAFHFITFYSTLQKNRFMHQWTRFYIISVIFKIILNKFLLPEDERIYTVEMNVRYLSQFQKTSEFFIHYNYWANKRYKLYYYGWDAPFALLYGVLEKKMSEKKDDFISYFIKLVCDLKLSSAYPSYPTKGSIVTEDLPVNTVIIQEEEKKKRLI